MSDIINSNIQSDLHLDKLKDRQMLNQFLHEYNIEFPADIDEKMVSTWEYFFGILAYMVENGVLDGVDLEEQVQGYKAVPDEKKVEINYELFDLATRRIETLANLETVEEIDLMQEEMDSLLARLPENIRQRYKYFLLTGQPLPEDFEEQLAQAAIEQGDEEIYTRLQKALDDKNKLNLKAMSPQELADKFGLESKKTPLQRTTSNVRTLPKGISPVNRPTPTAPQSDISQSPKKDAQGYIIPPKS